MRLSEVYTSVQGEGPRVGIPTVFVRFAGCNLRCPGWPCDTEHAIDPAKYRHEWEKIDPEHLVARIMRQVDRTGAENICLTGGEPFLQNHDELQALRVALGQAPTVRSVECFSNGTIVYPDWAVQDISFVMDWKLVGSGENPLNGARIQNLKKLANGSPYLLQAIKFVIKDIDDFTAAQTLWEEYVEQYSNIETFFGRVWNSRLSDAQLVEYVLNSKLPWRLNVQLHNYLWPPNERGR